MTALHAMCILIYSTKVWMLRNAPCTNMKNELTFLEALDEVPDLIGIKRVKNRHRILLLFLIQDSNIDFLGRFIKAKILDQL